LATKRKDGENMSFIMMIEGNVKFKLTLDPGVWIFDDRKVDLTTFFDETVKVEKEDEEDDVIKISKHWEREIQEGAVFPPTLKSEKTFEKEKVISGTFGIPFRPFLTNAEPAENASTVIIKTDKEEIPISIEKAYDLILGFSKDGKPLKEDGPVHVYYGDGSNKNSPITHVRAFIVK
jgi:hypothetical protein